MWSVIYEIRRRVTMNSGDVSNYCQFTLGRVKKWQGDV